MTGQAVSLTESADGPLDLTVDDIETAEATSRRIGDATVLSSPETLDARVVVDDDALTSGIEATDVTATVRSLHSEPDSVAGISFELGPDGATFAKPVLLEWVGPWSPTASYSLRAFHGDGTPVEDTGSTEANSIAALRVEPMSGTTARYTLPVDHFSNWSVFVAASGSARNFHLSAQSVVVPKQLDVGIRHDTTITVVASADRVTFRHCVGAVAQGVTGPIRVGIDSSTPTCGDRSRIDIPLTVDCTAAGKASFEVVVLALTIPHDGSAPPPLGSATDIGALMLRSANDLVELSDSEGTATEIVDGIYRSIMVRGSLSGTLRCVEPPATSTTGNTPASTTSTTPTTFTTDRTTSTTGSTVPTPTGGNTGPTTVPSATPTTPTTATTGTTPPTTKVVTTTTAAPSTTTTPPPTSAATTTTAAWGPVGAWAYNEFGSCNYNGSGGCGWYYGSTVGEYVLGPIGP